MLANELLRCTVSGSGWWLELCIVLRLRKLAFQLISIISTLL